LVEYTTVTVRSHCMVAGSIPAVERSLLIENDVRSSTCKFPTEKSISLNIEIQADLIPYSDSAQPF
jgi:hypothetical protein